MQAATAAAAAGREESSSSTRRNWCKVEVNCLHEEQTELLPMREVIRRMLHRSFISALFSRSVARRANEAKGFGEAEICAEDSPVFPRRIPVEIGERVDSGTFGSHFIFRRATPQWSETRDVLRERERARISVAR